MNISNFMKGLEILRTHMVYEVDRIFVVNDIFVVTSIGTDSHLSDEEFNKMIEIGWYQTKHPPFYDKECDWCAPM